MRTAFRKPLPPLLLYGSFLLFAFAVVIVVSWPSPRPRDPSPGRTLLEEDQEEVDSARLLLLLLLLMVAFLTAFSLREMHCVYVHESGTSILWGIVVGALVRFLSEDNTKIERVTKFEPELFFLFLLPPIIFESGYNTNKRVFFKNIVSICSFAMVGTAVSCAVIGLGLMVAKAIWGGLHSLTNIECFLFGALISATDPVTVLAIFKELKVDVNLYSNVFGESVLNDAVAIVLYKTLLIFTETSEIGGMQFLYAGSQFLIIFLGSLFTGTLVALLGAMLFKYAAIYKHPVLELCLLILYAYTSYLLAEALDLSGIVAILFCGMVMAHYTRQNVSVHTKELSKEIFEVWASLAETFVFLYLGLSVFAVIPNYNWAFILASVLLCLVGRALNVFPLSFGINVARGSSEELPYNHQFMLWFSGLRGAIAFALAMSYADTAKEIDHGPMILTTTLVIVLSTVIGLGGSTAKMLQLLSIKTGDDEDDAFPTPDVVASFDKKYIRPLFVRDHQPTLEMHSSSQELQQRSVGQAASAMEA